MRGTWIVSALCSVLAACSGDPSAAPSSRIGAVSDMGAGQSGDGGELAPTPDGSDDEIVVGWMPEGSVRAAEPSVWTTPRTPGRMTLSRQPFYSEAEVAWREWVHTLDGQPTMAVIELPVSGPVDEASIRDALVIVDPSFGERVEPAGVRYDEERGAILIRLQGLAPGRRLIYGLRGYEGGARGTLGQHVVAQDSFAALRDGAEVEAIEAIEALGAVERVRARELSWVIDQLAAYGVDHFEVAIAEQFDAASGARWWFEPSTGQLPETNDLLRDEETGRLVLPEHTSLTMEQREIRGALAGYNGFSTTGHIFFEASEALSLDAARTLRVFERSASGELTERALAAMGRAEDGRTIWARPEEPLTPGAQHVAMVGQARALSGERVFAQAAGQITMLPAPLTDAQGRSELPVLTDEEATRFERIRSQVADIKDDLATFREGDAELVVPFTTLSASDYLMRWRAVLYQQSVPVAPQAVEVRSPLSMGIATMPSVERVVTGTVPILDHLDPVTHRIEEDRAPRVRQVAFVMTLPRAARRGAPVPTVVFGHGLMTSRELTYMIANRLARAGYAVISLDLPLHGTRSICSRDESCEGGQSCNERGECVRADGLMGELVTVSGPWASGPSYPISTGERFIDMNDVVGSRDRMVQAVLDLCQLVRVVRGAQWSTIADGYVLDGDRVVYLGMSLGGILGGVLAAIEPTITDFALNVPGAGMMELLSNSAAFQSVFAQALSDRGLVRDPSSEGFVRLEQMIRWIFDAVDPINLVQHATMAPLAYDDPVTGERRQSPKKRLLIQMAEGDSVVPNISTRLLAERAHLPISVYRPAVSNHGFLFDPTSLEGADARDEIVTFFDAALKE